MQSEKINEVENLKILLIEDNPGDAKLIQKALSGVEDFELEWKKQLFTGIDYLKNNKIDLVLLDLSLPDSDGLETITKVKMQTKSVPIIILTGLNDETIGLKAVKAGAQDYLVKGMFDSNMLSRIIRYAIERKNTEEALRVSEQKLKEKNREMLEFTNNVTHDLKKPLATMKNICSIVSNESFSKLNGQGDEAIGMGKEAIDYMQELLDDLLNCAKLDAGIQNLKKENFNIIEILEQVLQRFKLEIEKRQISIFLEADAVIFADKKNITKVFMNLVGNAVNYIGESENPKIIVGSVLKNNEHLFFIKDTGLGIPEEIQSTIFQKFKRGTNVSGVSGTGLGLSIVKGVIDLHGGKIWIESKIGEGTTFWFTIPNLKNIT